MSKLTFWCRNQCDFRNTLEEELTKNQFWHLWDNILFHGWVRWLETGNWMDTGVVNLYESQILKGNMVAEDWRLNARY